MFVDAELLGRPLALPFTFIKAVFTMKQRISSFALLALSLLGASAQQPSETTILDLVIDAEAEKNVFWKYPVAVVVMKQLA